MPHQKNLGIERTQTKKATASPTFADLHWIAGFLEGEGTFIATTLGVACVRAVQVQREPLERLLKFLGGRISAKSPPSFRPGRNSQGSYHWHTSGGRARGIMMTLYPLMSPRRQGQIHVALTAKRRPKK